ncbi:CpaF family protein [Chengkuizengella axinellae]|uniref:ATPase, T2SS/T4P/T4SS family n=1 Tax=Chengkuizengella axinellae TaxID=3064388 RepID=A0ABT9J0W8_9BACL|nr:ATPase, T2SS/T4P/T4SS family [Chengkuizengella sp. 2205SS18-9]MDP5275242.1 ATPase, T2SS/T4P/T4SS family [Chengkuizengella sp. 2205SS18-9]
MKTSIFKDMDSQSGDQMKREEMTQLARQYLTQEIRQKSLDFSEEERVAKKLQDFLQNKGCNYQLCTHIVDSILVDIRGYGVIDSLANDPLVTDIIIHKHNDITYEKNGQKHNYTKGFRDQNHLMMFIEKLAYLAKSRVDISNPLATFTLPSGWRTAVSIPPISLHPSVAIRKFAKVPTVQQLSENQYFSEKAGLFFKAIIESKRNILFIGGMGSGKTTMIAIASSLFKDEEHPLLIEEVMECPMDVPHLRRLVARPPSVEGTGAIPLALLLKQGLMMKPTRVIVSEVRDGAIFYMFQAMLVGHEGSMSTIHANSAQEALMKRIPSMLSMSKEASLLSQEEKIAYAASALHFIVHLEQDPKTGKRYCRAISEIVEEPEPKVIDVFVRTGETMRATGHIPYRAIKGAAHYKYEYEMEWFKKK